VNSELIKTVNVDIRYEALMVNKYAKIFSCNQAFQCFVKNQQFRSLISNIRGNVVKAYVTNLQCIYQSVKMMPLYKKTTPVTGHGSGWKD
jgi:hypothetical protein